MPCVIAKSGTHTAKAGVKRYPLTAAHGRRANGDDLRILYTALAYELIVSEEGIAIAYRNGTVKNVLPVFTKIEGNIVFF